MQEDVVHGGFEIVFFIGIRPRVPCRLGENPPFPVPSESIERMECISSSLPWWQSSCVSCTSLVFSSHKISMHVKSFGFLRSLLWNRNPRHREQERKVSCIDIRSTPSPFKTKRNEWTSDFIPRKERGFPIPTFLTSLFTTPRSLPRYEKGKP